MSNDIDYRSVEVPENKAPEEYTYAERRAEILQLIEQAGHPAAIHQGQLANRYNCAQSLISSDINDHLADYVERSLGSHAALETVAVYRRSVRALQDADEHRKAWRTQLEFVEWAEQRADLDKRLEEIEERLAKQEQDESTNGHGQDIDGIASNGNGAVDLKRNR